MFFLGAGGMVWSVVGELIHSDWREAAAHLCMAVLALFGARVLWLGGRGRNVDIYGRNLDIPAAESDAMLQTLERYDRRLAEAQTAESARPGGTPHLLPDELEDERFYEPTDRGYEAKIAARMKERGDPG